jgi:hypothetical protein
MIRIGFCSSTSANSAPSASTTKKLGRKKPTTKNLLKTPVTSRRPMLSSRQTVERASEEA